MPILFKPKYTAGHWWQLFDSMVAYFIMLAFFLTNAASKIHLLASMQTNEAFKGMDLTFHDFDAPILICVGLLGAIAILRTVSFFVNDHLRWVDLYDDVMILHRVLGRSITVDYMDFHWNDAVLTASKKIKFPLIRMANYGSLRELLSTRVNRMFDEPVEFKPAKKTAKWHDLTVLAAILAGVGVIFAFYQLSNIDVTENLIGITDIVLGAVVILYIIAILRKLMAE